MKAGQSTLPVVAVPGDARPMAPHCRQQNSKIIPQGDGALPLPFLIPTYELPAIINRIQLQNPVFSMEKSGLLPW